jgi:hypothetical protein
VWDHTTRRPLSGACPLSRPALVESTVRTASRHLPLQGFRTVATQSHGTTSITLGFPIYAKLLTTIDSALMPVLLITPPEADTELITTLRGLGWKPHGTATPSEEIVTINDHLVRLTADDVSLFCHRVAAATAPVGWWQATKLLGDQCVVIATTAAHISLKGRDLPSQLSALLDSPHTVSALLPVTH